VGVWGDRKERQKECPRQATGCTGRGLPDGQILQL